MVYVEPFGGAASVLMFKPRAWMTRPDHLRGFVERLQHVVIESDDALKIIRTHDRDDALHYVDPPYVPATHWKIRKRKSEYRFELDDNGHAALAEVLRACRGCVVLSGYRCELYDELYRDWTRHDRAALADGARPRVESLWLSPRTAEALADEFAFPFLSKVP